MLAISGGRWWLPEAKMILLNTGNVPLRRVWFHDSVVLRRLRRETQLYEGAIIHERSRKKLPVSRLSYTSANDLPGQLHVPRVDNQSHFACTVISAMWFTLQEIDKLRRERLTGIYSRGIEVSNLQNSRLNSCLPFFFSHAHYTIWFPL